MKTFENFCAPESVGEALRFVLRFLVVAKQSSQCGIHRPHTGDRLLFVISRSGAHILHTEGASVKQILADSIALGGLFPPWRPNLGCPQGSSGLTVRLPAKPRRQNAVLQSTGKYTGEHFMSKPSADGRDKNNALHPFSLVWKPKQRKTKGKGTEFSMICMCETSQLFISLGHFAHLWPIEICQHDVDLFQLVMTKSMFFSQWQR